MALMEESDNRILEMHFVQGMYSRGLGILVGLCFLVAHVCIMQAQTQVPSLLWQKGGPIPRRGRVPSVRGLSLQKPRSRWTSRNAWQRGLRPAGGADGTRPFWKAWGNWGPEIQLLLQAERIQEVTGFYKHPRCSLTPARV